MDTMILRDWVISHNIEERTVKGFWKCFNTYKDDEPTEFIKYFGDFDPNLLLIKLKKVALIIGNWSKANENGHINDQEDYYNNYVKAVIPIIYNSKRIGTYGYLFTLSGQSFDDYFIID